MQTGINTAHTRIRPQLSLRLVLIFANLLLLVSGMLFMPAGHAERIVPEQTLRFDIPAQPVANALEVYARQAKMEFLIPYEALDGIVSTSVKGEFNKRRALQLLLKGTGLKADFDDEGGLQVTATVAPAGDRSAATMRRLKLTRADLPAETTTETSAEHNTRGEASDDDSSKGIPEMLVKGKRSGNTDIKRSEDAPQPYVIFDSKDIERSQAVNLEEFLKTRLPMNASTTNNGQGPATGNASTASSINLRGLGADETLILVDGRRMPGITNSGFPLQPDINGIPLAAIERVEVLPATAGGIYGGSATGGVINIVLRRDYRGIEGNATYVNTFDTDAANLRLDATAGFSLEGGRTQILFTATHSSANRMVIADRDFSQRAFGLAVANDPTTVYTATFPPLGSATNIVSYSFIGGVQQPLRLKSQYGGMSLGAVNTHVPIGYGGVAADGVSALIVNAGQYNLDYPLDSVEGGQRGLVASPSMESYTLSVRREFSSNIEAFVDISRLGNEGRSYTSSARSGTTVHPISPANPFTSTIYVRFPIPGFNDSIQQTSTTDRAIAGVIARLPNNWTGELDYSWSRSRSDLTGTYFATDYSWLLAMYCGCNPSEALGDPTLTSGPPLDALLDYTTYTDAIADFAPYVLPSPNTFNGPYENKLRNITLRLSGPIVDLPAGALTLSSIISRREERIAAAFSQTPNFFVRGQQDIRYNHPRSGDVDSYYLEGRIPLISSRNTRWSMVRDLELQVSARHDLYMSAGDPNFDLLVASKDAVDLPGANIKMNDVQSTDYTIALRYAPSESVALRASFGTGFLPPSVSQLGKSASYFQFGLGVPDPRRGDSDISGAPLQPPLELLRGGNPDLSPERSESLSLGMILTPRFIPGLRVSIDYVQIDKDDEIYNPSIQFLLDNESRYPDRIIRGQKLPDDATEWAGPILTIDASATNIARTKVEAYDVQADYLMDTRIGALRWYAVATYQPHYKNLLLPDSPSIEYVGYTGGPLKFRGNMGLTWDRGPLSLNWNAQYYDGYRVYTPTATAATVSRQISIQGSEMLPSQMYHDMYASYRVDGLRGLLGSVFANSEISIGVQNVFDKVPPIIASTDTISPGYSYYGDPRLRRYTISVRKSFH